MRSGGRWSRPPGGTGRGFRGSRVGTKRAGVRRALDRKYSNVVMRMTTHHASRATKAVSVRLLP
jgi:hypothetical protein